MGASEGQAAPASKAPAPSPTTAGAPTGRGKGRRQAAGKGAASGAPEEPPHATFARDTVLRYRAGAQKTGMSAARLDAYRSARSVGDFFDLHPRKVGAARRYLGYDPRKQHCSTLWFTPRFLRTAGLDPAGVAHAVMAAASPVDPWAPLPAAVCAVESVASDAAGRALLARFAEYERIEVDAHKEPLAGSLASLAPAVQRSPRPCRRVRP